MSEYDTAAATAALEAHFDSETASTPEPASQETQSVPSGVTPGTEPPAQPDSLFHGIDPEKLSPEQRVMFDSMNSQWTQKTQDVASLRKQLEALGSLDEVQQSVQFVRSLEDPQQLLTVHQQMSQYLQSLGLSPQEADYQAQGAVDAGFMPESGDEYGDPFYNDPRVDALNQKLDEFSSWKQQLDNERLESAIELNLSRQEQAIRAGNPHYDDNDVGAIYQLSYAYGGDLTRAQQSYEGERNRILSAYAAQKGSISPSVTSPQPGAVAASELPKMTFNEAHQYAKAVAASIEKQN